MPCAWLLRPKSRDLGLPSNFVIYDEQDSIEMKLEEEQRLFYVALTRAKRRLILSSYRMTDWGHEKPPSSFLAGLS